MTTRGAVLRPYRPADRDRVALVCTLTGDAGGDATGRFADDGLLPHLYALPHVDFQPDLATVVEIDGEVQGYVLGVSDVAAFSRWWASEWAPVLRRRFPAPGSWPDAQRQLLEGALDGSHLWSPLRVDHPAEFHVDLLPDAQGLGLGRGLVERFCSQVRARGAPGIAIGVDARNTNAVDFYRHLGLEVLDTRREDGRPVGHTLGLRLAGTD